MGSDKKFISELAEGERVISQFLVQSKQLLTTKSGKPYISMILQDRTGRVSAKVWDSALEFFDTFKVNDVIKIDGNIELYNKELQVVVRRLRPAGADEVDLADFLPRSENDMGQKFEELREYAGKISNQYLKALLEKFFDDADFVKKFMDAPAARNIHHVYVGGLLEHTLSTVRLCEYLSSHYPTLDSDLLLTMAILHDIGKVDELQVTPSISYTEQGNLLGHIIIGIQLIDEKIAQIPEFPPKLRMLVEHMVLSHHGQSEWGSPRPPMILEAEILHRADDLDVKVDIFTRALSDDRDPESPWTAYQKSLERILYKKPTYETDLSPEQSPS